MYMEGGGGSQCLSHKYTNNNTVQFCRHSLYILHTVQLYNCTTLQLYNCTTVQLYNCTTVPRSLKVDIFKVLSKVKTITKIITENSKCLGLTVNSLSLTKDGI